MKLLKLPEPPSAGNVSSMITIPFVEQEIINGQNKIIKNTEYLITSSLDCEINIWNVEHLQKASENTFDGIPQIITYIASLKNLKNSKGCNDKSSNYKLLYTTENSIGNIDLTLYAVTDKNIYVLNSFQTFLPGNHDKSLLNAENAKCLIDTTDIGKETQETTIVDAQCSMHNIFVMMEIIDSDEKNTAAQNNASNSKSNSTKNKPDEKQYLVRVFDSQNKVVFDIKLNDQPVSFIVDPLLEYLVVFNLNKSVKFYRFDMNLKYGEFYSKLHSIICNVEPTHYKVNMAPQGNFVPLINNANSSKVGSTLICDFNNKFKIIDTLLTPSTSNFKILKYSPKIFSKVNKKNPEIVSNYNLIATADSVNDSIMIWNTHRKKPLFQGAQITHSQLKAPISDLAWSTDGMSLFVVSKDGYISGLFFKSNELGAVMDGVSFKDLQNELKPKLPSLKIPATSKTSNTSTTSKKSTSVTIVSAKSIDDKTNTLESKDKVAEVETPDVITSNTMKFNPPSYSVPKDLKRIAPTQVSSATGSTLANAPGSTTNNKTNKKPKKDLDSMDFLDTSLLIPAIAFSKVRLATPKTRLLFEYKFSNKYRITVTNGNSTELKPTKIVVNAIKLKDKNKINGKDGSGSKISAGFFGSGPISSAETLKVNQDENIINDSSSGEANVNSLTGTPIENGSSLGDFTLSSQTRDMVADSTTSNKSQKNSSSSSKLLFHHVQYIPKYVTIATGSATFFAFVTDQGAIHIHSVISGMKLCPPLILGVPISFLESCGTYLSCITTTGQLYCWDISSLKLKFPVSDIYPLLSPTLRYSDDILSRAENITSFSITDFGVPIVTLSNGDGYMFDDMMQTWLLINDSWWAYGSQYWDLTNTQTEYGMGTTSSDLLNGKKSSHSNALNSDISANISSSNSNGILKYLESKTNDELYRRGVVKLLQKFAKTMLMKEGFENLEEVVTLAHLENKILVLLRLNDMVGFENIMIVYCLKLGEMDYQNRLNEVFQWLYGEEGQDSKINDTLSKHELLRKILISCADLRQIQRLTLTYIQALDINE